MIRRLRVLLAFVLLLALPPLVLGGMLHSIGVTERTEFMRTAALTATTRGTLTRLGVRKEKRPGFPWGDTYVIALRYAYAVDGQRFDGAALRDAFLRGRLRDVWQRISAFAPGARHLQNADFSGEPPVDHWLRITHGDVDVAYDPQVPSHSAAVLGGTLRDLRAARAFEIVGRVLMALGALLAAAGIALAAAKH